MWQNYFEQTKDKPPSAYLVQAVQILGHPNHPTALDLGSGGGRDSRFLASQGFTVTSVDAAPIASQYVTTDHITFVTSTFEDFPFQTYDLIASFSLPFLNGDQFMPVWRNIRQSLNLNGIFVGELFGPTDSWNNNDNEMTFHSRSQIEELLQGLHIHQLQEDQGNGTTLSGEPKHWHIFHIIAQNLTHST